MAALQTIDEVLRRMGQEGWALRAERSSPRQVELWFTAGDSFPGMMDEMFDNEPFGGEQQLVTGHIFDNLLRGRLIQKVSEGDTWVYFELTKAGQKRAMAPVLAHSGRSHRR